MKSLTLSLSAVVLALAFAACGDGVNSDPNNNNNNSFNASLPCSTANKCPSGQFCFNGICAVGCNSNKDCADDEFCDDFWRECHSKVVKSCPTTACPATQSCVNGLCTSKEPAPMPSQCDPKQVFSGVDGCEQSAVCLQPDENEKAKCYSFPACGEGGSCPVGATGAVCNDPATMLTKKGRICLPELCKTAANCPSNWFCVRMASNDVVGICENGAMGSMCSKDEECLSPLKCQGAMPGMPGMCINSGF